MESKCLTVKSRKGKVLVNEIITDGARWWLVDDIASLVGADVTFIIESVGAHMMKFENYKCYVDAFSLFKLNPILQDSVLDNSLMKILLRKKTFDYKASDFRRIVGTIRSCKMETESLQDDINLCDRANLDIYHDFENGKGLDLDYFKNVLNLRREKKRILRLYEIMNKYFDGVDLEALESEICKHKSNMDKKAYNRRLSKDDEENLKAKINNL